MAREMWEKMGNRIDWSALEILCDYFGVDDPAAVIDDLITLRNQLQLEAKNHG